MDVISYSKAKKALDTAEKAEMFYSAYAIPLDGMTIGTIILVANPVILGTVTL